MKKECLYTQGMLRRYLKGYLFLPQKKRVERHLASCPVCRSRNDALRQTDETREILRYLDASRGIADRLKTGLGGIARLFFRPLWMVLIVAAAFALHQRVIVPLLHDPDLEKLDAGAPPGAVKPESEPRSVPTATPPAVAPPLPVHPAQVAAVGQTDPLVVTIVLEKEHEKAGMVQINEAMKEHAVLTHLRFSEKVRSVTGSLTPDELYTFFGRIREAGKITYKRSRLAAAPAGEPLNFILRLQTAASAPRQPAAIPAEKPEVRPAERLADGPATAPAAVPENVPATAPPQAPQ